jgi:hypothetical protein
LNIETINLEQEMWFRISDSDKIRPFFMNVVSDSNHWLFISSNGGLTAGRKNSEFALFPYYTDDKITESAEMTGSKTILRVHSGDRVRVWEPFSVRCSGKFNVSRNLYKNFHGNKIMFEEVNHDLGLTFRYQWNSSNLFGFVRKSELHNHSGSDCRVSMVDGIQNIMPYGVEPDMQNASSNLVDAYKRSELVAETGLGIYALSAIIVDRAEPSEALKANVAWSLGLDRPGYLLSSLQLDSFRKQLPIYNETDVKGEKGAYFVHTEILVKAKATRSWKIVANVNQNHAQVIALIRKIREEKGLDQVLEQDIRKGTVELEKLIAGADGMRRTADSVSDARHYSNVLFNIMRGGTFDNNYQIEKNDLVSYLGKASRKVLERNSTFLDKLEDTFFANDLYELLSGCEDPDLYRLCKEYLPLKFSRRHGDPSRPWNRFSINTHCELDGSKILDYQGNWRDIFQNWEALVHSYPCFIEGMIFKFLNASTFDGYNPYRVTKDGFDWETIEPDNPWSYIGYWGDHQIIYLLKFLEFYQKHKPDALEGLLNSDYFAYANVPYRIRPYEEIARDPKNTIDFDEKADQVLRANMIKRGADAALLCSKAGEIHRVNFLEKILATVLAKISNFIPEGGIWLNTQRPEWNDANNALVGNGVSMVTLYYLRRFLRFIEGIIDISDVAEVQVSSELGELFLRIQQILDDNRGLLDGSIDDRSRKIVTDALGRAGSDYRSRIYNNGFSGDKSTLTLEMISEFLDVSLLWMEHSIDANRRPDHLFHAYNIMSFEGDGLAISYLSEMLEGQVAVLSSGYLESGEAVKLLDAMRISALYREDQNSYMLYPNKELPGFLERNNVPESLVRESRLLRKLVDDGNLKVIMKDVAGGCHFNGNFRNAGDLKSALEELASAGYKKLVEEEQDKLLDVFEKVFNHKAFTGRSGTFFAYEGLGSIYWHMVSKLHLAVQEVCLEAVRRRDSEATIQSLRNHYYEIGEGIGIHKTPEEYGAFPTDPYSHTPFHRGAQQPGMTGQVKEDILVSIYELGVNVEQGRLSFRPQLLRKILLSDQPGSLDFVTVEQQIRRIEIPKQALCFSCCQVPVVYQAGPEDRMEVFYADGTVRQVGGLNLDEATSAKIFQRTAEVAEIRASLQEEHFIC